MRIVTRKELQKMPDGTVFMEYIPEMTNGRIHIKTGTYKDLSGWNGELMLDPSWDFESNETDRFCHWWTTDNSMYDYSESQKFIVLSKTEVQQMINALMWALTGCESYFNQDIWINGDTILTDEEFNEEYR